MKALKKILTRLFFLIMGACVIISLPFLVIFFGIKQWADALDWIVKKIE
jgi:hypothetical protein